jgi:hypothetical protein
MVDTVDYPTEQNNAIAIFILIVLVAILLVVAGQAIVAHADTKHGMDAQGARQCLSDPNSHIFFNQTTKRFGVVCNIGDLWGVVIQNAQREEITAFLKNKMHSFEQVIKYMQNGGYQLIH